MTPRRNPSRTGKDTGLAGVKMLATATSLAAVVGGWAALTFISAKSADGEPPALPEEPEPLVLELEPIPTLVPEVRPELPLRAAGELALSGGIPVANPNGALFSGTSLPAGSSPGLPKLGNDRDIKEGSAGREKPAKPEKPDPVADSRPS